MLRRWGSDTRKFDLSTELIMQIDHRTEIEKLTFRALALRQSIVSRLTMVRADPLTMDILSGFLTMDILVQKMI